LLGDAAHGAVAALAALGLEETPRFVRRSVQHVGADLLESFAARD
jgi:hypothetical protein